jgi:hypothetical protein
VGDYSIYIIFPNEPDNRQGRLKVYAGRTASKDVAIEWAYGILNDEGASVEAVEIIDWRRPDEIVYRIDRDGG